MNTQAHFIPKLNTVMEADNKDSITDKTSLFTERHNITQKS